MREPVDSRRRRILDVLEQHGEVKVAHLAALLNVSMVTVRRDLETLSRHGSVQRRHGMVARAEGQASTPPLDRGAQGTIAVIAPERHSYLNEVTRGARDFLEHAGYRVILHLTPNTPNPEQHILEQISKETTDGLLLAPRWRAPEQEAAVDEALAALDLPTVLLERRPSSGGHLQRVDSVRSDHRHGVHLAVDHLRAGGHRRILLAARQDSPTARTVNAAFSSVMEEMPGVDHWMSVLSSPDAAATSRGAPDPARNAEGPTDHPDYANPDWLPELLEAHGFTAVLIHSDENALVLSQRLALAGVQVPHDCAVIAYDDVVAGLGSVPLTAVSPPKEEVGRAAAQLLSQRIRAERQGGRWIPRRIELLPSLEIRSST